MQDRMMTVSQPVITLALVIAVLAVAAAATGLFWQGDGAAYEFTSLRGDEVTIYGHGLYQYDTAFRGAGNRGTDVITLVLGVPLLIAAVVLYRRGSLSGGLLLTGALTYMLYVYASLALATAYNRLFLVYIALFSASLFALVLVVMAFDQDAFARRVVPHLPRTGPAVFMIISGVITAAIWLGPLLSALIDDRPPEMLDTYTTTVTDVLDLGLITPLAIVAGILILRRAALGYIIACGLLVLEISLAPMIIAQTIFQLDADVSFTTGEIVGPIIGFVVLALIAVGVLVHLLRRVQAAVEISAAH